MPGSIELSEFFVEGKQTELSHVLLHITEPSTPTERQKGYFFALIEIEHGDRGEIEELQHIIEEIEASFYQMNDTPEKTAFELALEYANRKGGNIHQKNTDNHIHCVVGNVQNNTLTFSYRGDVHALIFYHGPDGVEQINILKEHDENPQQLFSSTLVGVLGDDDIVFIGTPHVTDHFTYDRLQKLLSTRNPRESANHIGRVLEDIGDELSFGGIVFHVSAHVLSPRTGKMIPKHTQGSVSSLNSLITAQQQTEDTLSPPLLQGVRSRLKEHLQKDSQLAVQETTRKQLHKTTHSISQPLHSGTNHRQARPQESLINRLLVRFGHGLVSIAIGLWAATKYLLTILWRSMIILIILVANKNNSRKEILGRVKERWEHRKRAVRKMSLLSKILLIVITIFALMFVGSIVYLKAKEHREMEVRAYTTSVNEINQLKEQADVKMVYNDSEKAMELLQSAQLKIESLPNDTDEQKKQQEELSSSIHSLLAKLRKVEVVSPTNVINIQQLYPQASVDQITLLDNSLYLFGPNDTILYTIDLETEQTKTIPHEVLPSLTASAIAKETQHIIFISGPTTIADFSKDTSTVSPKDIASPNTNTNFSAIDIYNDKLYTVDPNNNQIYKHNRTLTGFDKGTPWVQDTSINLNGASSITIDGDVYVLTTTADVIKLHRGVSQPFTLAPVDPILTSPTVIWTSADTEKIYILEPQQRRILIFNKDGKFNKQLTAEEWKNPTGMTIDTERQLIYIIDNNTISSIPLE